MTSSFINRNGYKCPQVGSVRDCLIFRKAIFEFTLDADMPLTYRTRRGLFVRPDRHFLTDKGSIPVPLRGLLPSDTYERPYLFHDSGFLHHGLWFSPSIFGPFTFTRMHMAAVNDLLAEMMDTEGAWGLTRGVVHGAVGLFGRFPWHNQHRRTRAGSQMPVEDEDEPVVGVGGPL